MWALITGAGSGIGRALAWELAGQGYDLVIAGRTDTHLSQVASEIRGIYQQRTVETACVDFSDPLQSKVLAQRVKNLTDHLEVLVHCAGAGEPAADFATLDYDDFQRAMAVNVSAPMLLVQALLPLLSGHEPASRIVVIGAGMDKRVQPGTGSYGISKMALRRLMLQLSVEFDAIPQGPVISLFQPGLVDTPGIRRHREKAAHLGLPHVQWLSDNLEKGDCLTAEQAASALTYTLCQLPESEFHGAVLHAPELVDALFFSGS